MAADLWDSERQRTARFVEQRRRDAQSLSLAVLRRVNAHVVYSEHRQAQLQEDSDDDSASAGSDGSVGEQSQPHEDLALDFLGDVDMDDMKSLLVNAASSASASASTAATAAATAAVAVMAPLTMPTHLLTTTTTSMAFAEDAGVSELMDELEIDVRSFASTRRASTDEEEERKTEESTPPRHVLEQRVQASPKTTPSKKPKINETVKSKATTPEKYDPEAVAQEMFRWVDGERHPDVVKRRESLRGEKRKRVRRYGTNTLEEQASVRRLAKYYAAEGESSSSSSSSSAEDSDFSPVEIVEVDDDELLDKVQDEEPFSETELQLGDDDDDDDDDVESKRKKKAKARRRIRQQQAADKKPKKKPRTKMVKKKEKTVAVAVAVAVEKTVKVTTPPRAVNRLAATEEMEDDEEEEEEEEIRRPRVFAKPAPKPVAKPVVKPVPVKQPTPVVVKQPTPVPVKQSIPAPVNKPEAIDLRSESENESMSERDVAVDMAFEVDDDDESASEEDQPASQPAEKPGSMVLKLKVSPKDLLELTQKEMLAKLATTEEPAQASEEADPVVLPVAPEPVTTSTTFATTPEAEDDDDGYGTDEIIDEEEEEEVPVPVEMPAAPASPIAPVSITETVNDPIPDEADAKSDTGTVDFEQEELDVELPEPTVAAPIVELEEVEPTTITPKRDGLTRVPPAAENKLQPVSPQVKRSPPTKARVLAEEEQPLVMELQEENEDGDVSETGTVDFEEVDSDIDFGSGESEDFGEDGAVMNSAKDVEEEKDDDEAEFGQFFGAPLKKKKKVATVPAKPQPVASAKHREISKTQDASPVKPIRSNGTHTPSPETAGKAKTKTSLLVADVRGSNGLRKVQNVNTKTVTKGKFQYARRAIQLIDERGQVLPDHQSEGETVHDPKRSLLMRSRLPQGELSPKGIRPLQLRRSSSMSEEGDKSRYLAYGTPAAPSRPTTKDQFSLAARTARERYDKTPAQAGKDLSSGISFVTSVGTGAGLLKPLSDEAKKAKSASYVPPREPQMDVYQATGAVSQIDDGYLDGYDKDGHKRPVVYQKEIAEAKRNGINVKKGLPLELDPNARIPKKSTLQLNYERNPELHAPFVPQPVTAREEKQQEPPKSKRAKTSSEPVANDGRPSKYGPTQGLSHPPSGSGKKNDKRKDPPPSSNGHRGGNKARDSNGSSSHSKKRQREPSPQRSRDGGDREWEREQDRKRDRERERDRERQRERERDRGRGHGRGNHSRGRDHHRPHGRSRSRSPNDSRPPARQQRSLSPRGRSSYGPTDPRDRGGDSSRSRNKSPPRSRSAGEDSSRRPEEKTGKPDERDQRSQSYDEKRRQGAQPPSYSISEQLARSMGGPLETGSPLKQPPSSKLADPPAKTKPLDVEDDGSDIADSDDGIPMHDASFDGDGFAFNDDDAAPPVFDIRVPLDEIEIDEELCRRTIYCSNLVHMCDEEILETQFSQYGIAEDRATGFPAVEVFLCQRTNRPRGDARITFESAEQAELAVSEVNFATFGNAKLKVRVMDPRTMRILKAQFDMHRDTWTCPSTSCRADVSVWTVTCPKCYCKRQFAASRVNIDPNGWLCSICYMPNLQHTDKCSSCECTLPPYQAPPSTRLNRPSDRSRSRSRSRSRERGRDRDRGRDRRSY